MSKRKITKKTDTQNNEIITVSKKKTSKSKIETKITQKAKLSSLNSQEFRTNENKKIDEIDEIEKIRIKKNNNNEI